MTVFWGSLAGFFVVVGVVLSRTGYSRDFDREEGSVARGLVALAVAFVSIVRYFGLLQFELPMIPVSLAVLGGAIALVMFEN